MQITKRWLCERKIKLWIQDNLYLKPNFWSKSVTRKNTFRQIIYNLKICAIVWCWKTAFGVGISIQTSPF